MKVLVIGSGGREHALVWKIGQSPKVKKIFCASGNAGIEQLAECVNIKQDDIAQLLKFAQSRRIDLTVVGPELALVNGIVDEFSKNRLKIFGPTKNAARLEGSKVFAKEFMKRHNIPAADFEIFSESSFAKDYLKNAKFPVVIKADGLAAGKGVSVCNSLNEAIEAVESIMEKRSFGSSGNKIVIEECLKGEEASILAICDAEDFVLLSSSQDHKRIFDEDSGPNTGGMGAYSPAPVVTDELLERIKKEIFRPVINGLKEENMPFKGVLYAGLMISEGSPKVLEFNVRFGDPETQAMLPRLDNDLVEVMLASIEGTIKKVKLSWKQNFCVCVVLSSKGYPGRYETGKEILGLEKVKGLPSVFVFHAGTKSQALEREKEIFTNGGRVLNVVGMAETIDGAIKKTYEAVESIDFEGKHYRKDIGFRALRRN